MTEKSSLLPSIQGENAVTESIFMWRANEVHLSSRRLDHFRGNVKTPRFNSRYLYEESMPRTVRHAKKGGTAIQPRPFPLGRGFRLEK